MPDAGEDAERPAPRGRLLAALALAVAPLALLGPILAAGLVFLPYLPVGLEPLARENPAAAEAGLRDANFVLGDRIFHILTDQLAMREEVWRGSLPTWESRLGMGLPLIGGTIAGGLYPPNVLALLLPPERAAAPLAFLSLFLAGLGMGLFLRRLGLGRGAALAGALGLQLGGWGLANLYYYMKVDAALWLPWALWAVDGVARRRRGSGLWLTASLALSFLAGMVTISLFVLCLTAAYALVRWPRAFGSAERAAGLEARRSPLWGTLACGAFLALGVAGAAAQLLPLAEAGGRSLRVPATPEDLRAQSLPPATGLGFVVPDLLGPPTTPWPTGQSPVAWWLTPAGRVRSGELANQLEWNTYAGAAVVLLALVGLVAGGRRALFPGMALGVVLGFAQAWPGLSGLYSLPGLGVGAPGRALGLAWMLWPWLAALGVDALVRSRPRALPTLLVGAGLLLATALWLRVGFEPERWASELETTLVARHGPEHGTTLEEVRARIPPELSLRAGRELGDSLTRFVGASFAALVAALFAFFGTRQEARGRPYGLPFLGLGSGLVAAAGLLPLVSLELDVAFGAAPALLAIPAVLALLAVTRVARFPHAACWLPLLTALVVEGTCGARGHVGGRPILSDGLFPPSAAIEAVREAAGDGRVVRVDSSPGGTQELERLARPDMLVPYGINDLMSYPLLTPRELVELYEAIDPRTRLRNHVTRLPDPAQLSHPILDLTRATAVLSTRPLDEPGLVSVLDSPGFHVYHREGALPPARIVLHAVAAKSDEAVLEALSSGAIDFGRETWIAPEFASSVGPPEQRGDWRTGNVTSFERPARNRLRLEVEETDGGWLVIHEQWAPGWRASIDGREVELVRADHACRALRIPPGSFTVELHHAPRSLFLGLGVGIGALLLAFLLDRALSAGARA